MVRSKYSTSLSWYSKTNMVLQCLREQFASDVKNICFIVSWKANVSPTWTRNHLLYRMYICTPIIVLYGKWNKHMLSTSKQDLIHLDSFFPNLTISVSPKLMTYWWMKLVLIFLDFVMRQNDWKLKWRRRTFHVDDTLH